MEHQLKEHNSLHLALHWYNLVPDQLIINHSTEIVWWSSWFAFLHFMNTRSKSKWCRINVIWFHNLNSCIIWTNLQKKAEVFRSTRVYCINLRRRWSLYSPIMWRLHPKTSHNKNSSLGFPVLLSLVQSLFWCHSLNFPWNEQNLYKNSAFPHSGWKWIRCDFYPWRSLSSNMVDA